MMRHRILIALVILVLGNLPTRSQQPEAHIYSNVEYNKGGGDLLGFEIRLITNGGEAKGSLKIYEGGCAAPIAISGSLTGNKVELTAATEEYGRIEVVGNLRKGGLDGKLRFEKTGESETLSLKEISKPHC